MNTSEVEVGFDQDPYPGKPKILFIGNPTSAHVQGWINLLVDYPLNIRLFASADGYPPKNWPVKVYLITKYPPASLDCNWRRSWFPAPEVWLEHDKKVQEAIEDEKKREYLIQMENEWRLEVQSIELQYQQAVSSFFETYEKWKREHGSYISEVISVIEDSNIADRTTEHQRLIEQYNRLVSITQLLIDDYDKTHWLEKSLWLEALIRLYHSVFSPQKIYHLSLDEVRQSFEEITHKLDEKILELEEVVKTCQNPGKFPVVPLKIPYPPRPPLPPPSYFPIDPPRPMASTPEAWLADVIQAWKPDIIHTFGVDSGSEFYYQTRKNFRLEELGKWVIKVFGGSDLAFSLYDPIKRERIASMFSEADQILFDNKHYIHQAVEKGVLQSNKISPLTPVPGSGGISVDHLRSWISPPSSRRVIIWPKSYETIWSKAIPVLMALRNVFEQIQPCEVYMLTANSEVKSWFSTFPDEVKKHFHLFEGVTRDQVLEIMLTSRIMLAPSLIDGVPNSMYEAMACGCLPIVSPLETIKAVVNEENVLFVNNLDQPAIETAIIRAMQDDRLVDDCAYRNVELVKKLADEENIKILARNYYEDLYNQKVPNL